MVILQSKALSTRDLETYIFWLLEQGELLQNESTVVLQIHPPSETVEKINQQSVKNIKIGSPLKISKPENDSSDDTDKPKEKEITQARAVKLRNAISIDLLKALLPESFFENRNLSDCFDDANLKVNLEIFYSRKTTQKGQEFIDSIATSMRHMNEDDVQINLQGGGTIKGDKLQLSAKIKVDVVNGLIDETSLFKQMKEWLFTKIESEEVNE